ncbi:MAG: hypothetical protein FVQ77_10075 [Cytophagales bacterium]|nr:hypothetical protein [Cytophagales bacterium]
MIETGTAKTNITTFKKGVGMMGYGQYSQKVEGVETDLFARAFVFLDTATKKKTAFVNVEICFITISIKSAVIKKLQKEYPQSGLNFDNVMLTAQHTHSAPGGYSHYPFYNFSIPGFVTEVFQTIVDGIVDAIIKAEKATKPSNIYIGNGTFEPEIQVAFNRSIKAYNANPDVERLDEKDNHLATDREMILMRIDGMDGKSIGMINWFGVHTTSIGNDNKKISSDNKGYASTYFEESNSYASPPLTPPKGGRTGQHFTLPQGKSDDKVPPLGGFRGAGDLGEAVTAIFAQGPCGDVSPNYIWDAKRKKLRGKYEDDHESAKYNGKLQYTKAKEIYLSAVQAGEQAAKNDPVNEKGYEWRGIDYGLMYVDFSKVFIDPEFVARIGNPRGDKQEKKTGSPCLGVSFFLGHPTDGKGMPDSLGYLSIFLCTFIKLSDYFKAIFSSKNKRDKIFEKYKIQGRKYIMAETAERKMLGIRNINYLMVPSWVDKSFATFKKQYRIGALNDKPWTPQILPLQIIIIANIAIAGIPTEITTVAGRRLKKTIHEILKQRGVKQVILSPYANAYSGYITTFEEYQVQCYEGGHTVFGEWTLAAFQTKFKQLANEMLKKEPERNLDTATKPVEFSEEELKKRSFSM